jgi:hypothetical protein
MPGQFSGSAVIDRPIEDVFGFLAAGTNDPKFSPRVLEIRTETDGPPAVGTVFVSKVKDAGMTTDRRFELTALQAPTRIRWSERSRNLVTVTEGGIRPRADRRLPDQGHRLQLIRGPWLWQGARRVRSPGRRQGRRRVRTADQGCGRGELGRSITRLLDSTAPTDRRGSWSRGVAVRRRERAR